MDMFKWVGHADYSAPLKPLLQDHCPIWASSELLFSSAFRVAPIGQERCLRLAQKYDVDSLFYVGPQATAGLGIGAQRWFPNLQQPRKEIETRNPFLKLWQTLFHLFGRYYRLL